MRSAIFCSPGVSLSLWHFTHLNKRLLTAAALQLVIQYPELLSSFKVAPLPPSAHFMWHCCMIRFDTFSPFGKMIGCLFSLFANNLLSQPSTHIIPLLFKNVPNCLIVELLGIVTSLLTYEFCWKSFFLSKLDQLSLILRSLTCNGSLVASIFIYLRRICLNLNTQDMTLFILSLADIFSSNWWSMSKDTSVLFVLSSFFNSGSPDDTSKKLVRSPGQIWFPKERRTIELCFCYIYSSWVVVSWVCLGVYMKPLGVTRIFTYDFNSICNKHFELSWLVSDLTQNNFTIWPKYFSCNWNLKLFLKHHINF